MQNSLINIDPSSLSEVGKLLIEKISDAIGVVWEPQRIQRIAKAKTEAAKTEAQGKIEITDMVHRALRRWITEETQYQQNIEAITAAALPDLNEEANPSSMDNDWLVNFFDKGRKISDDEMQSLWAHILSGEANTPGAFSKRTVNCVAELNRSEAELFTSLCKFVFVWQPAESDPLLLIFDYNAEIYTDHGIGFDSLQHLENIGLIKQIFPLKGLALTNLPKYCTLTYHGQPLVLELSKDADNEIRVGYVMFTSTGRELASICTSQPVEGFWEYVRAQWSQYLPKLYRDN